MQSTSRKPVAVTVVVDAAGDKTLDEGGKQMGRKLENERLLLEVEERGE